MKLLYTYKLQKLLKYCIWKRRAEKYRCTIPALHSDSTNESFFPKQLKIFLNTSRYRKFRFYYAVPVLMKISDVDGVVLTGTQRFRLSYSVGWKRNKLFSVVDKNKYENIIWIIYLLRPLKLHLWSTVSCCQPNKTTLKLYQIPINAVNLIQR